MPEKVVATEAALAIIEELKKVHGPLMFYQSGGCCEGSAPLCLEEGELLVGDNDILLGQIAGCNFYMLKDQYEYWKHTQLIIDVSNGAEDTFSIEGELGVHFSTRSRLFTGSEKGALFGNVFRLRGQGE